MSFKVSPGQGHNMIPLWAARLVGIPYKAHGRDYGGADCYALIYLAYRDVFKIEIPSYAGAYASPGERDEIAALLMDEIPEGGWRPILGPPRAGDGAVFRLLGQPWHVGLMVTSRDFIHVSEDIDPSAIETLDSFRWNHRLYGIYRHEALA